MIALKYGFELALRDCRWAYDLATDVPSEIIERGNGQAVLIPPSRHDNTCRIGIAGTNDIEDIAQAAQFCGRRNRHLGFYVHSLRLKKALEKRIPLGCELILSGHSLGGVTAMNLSLDMAPYCKRINVYSFGAPKAFRKPFRLPSNVRWTIVVNDMDLVQDYPILKRFDWDKMVDLNGSVLRLVFSRNLRYISFPQRSCRIISEGIRSFAPITNTYETIRKYHSLTEYEELLRIV